MNEWEEIKYIFSHKFYGAISEYLITMLATVVFDLTIAIIIGVAYSAIMFVLTCTKLDVYCHKDRSVPEVDVAGAVFFINLGELERTIENMLNDSKELVIDMSGVSVIDVSSAEYFLELCEANPGVVLKDTNKRVKSMLKRAGLDKDEEKESVNA